MARRDTGYPSAWVVSVAAILAVLPAASWVVSMVWLLLLGSRTGATARLLLSHPLGLVRGALVAGISIVAAWLLEEDRWPGAVVAGAMFVFSALAAAVRSRGRVSSVLVLALVSLGFAIQAYRLLRRYKSAPSKTVVTASAT